MHRDTILRHNNKLAKVQSDEQYQDRKRKQAQEQSRAEQSRGGHKMSSVRDNSGRDGNESVEDVHVHVHVLVLPYPTQGHINPMLRLGRMLKDAAVAAHVPLSVTVATADHALRRIQNAGHAGDSPMLGFADGLPLDFHDWLDVEYIRRGMCQHGPPSLRALLERLRPSVSCIIYDTFLEWVPPLAQHLHLPCAAFWSQSCAVLYAYAQALAHADSDSQALAAAALTGPLEGAGLGSLGEEDLPSFLQPGQRGGFYERWFLEQLSVLAGARTLRWILGNSFAELEPHHARRIAEEMPVRFATVGPLVAPAYEDGGDDETTSQMLPTTSRAECATWLGRQRPGSVVYVSFGSLASIGEAQTREVGRALRESNVPFLWSARAASAEEEAALSEAAESGMGIVVPWAPQGAILAHPAVGAFVSHCGWNSTLEAMVAGVPMVCVPQFSDQPTDAAFVDRVWRNGVIVPRHIDQNLVHAAAAASGNRLISPPGIIPAEKFVQCLRQVLDGDDKCIRCNAASLRNAARAATAPPAGSSWSNLVALVSELATETCTERCTPALNRSQQ